MSDYSRQIASAKASIAAKGVVVPWKQAPASTPADPNKPWLPSVGTPAEHNVSIVFLPAGSGKAMLQYFGQTNVISGAVIGLMGAVEFTPQLADTVVRDSQVYRIGTIDTIKPGSQDILHIIQFVK
jgi:hypothetical protein